MNTTTLLVCGKINFEMFYLFDFLIVDGDKNFLVNFVYIIVNAAWYIPNEVIYLRNSIYVQVSKDQ